MSDHPYPAPPKDTPDEPFSLKPLMALAIHEAVKWAFVDCASHPGKIPGEAGPLASEEERAKWLHDIYSMPSECFAQMDPGAVAQNICNRLMGSGGWRVNGVYAGNATPQQILECCIHRPDQDPVGDVMMDLGLTGDAS